MESILGAVTGWILEQNMLLHRRYEAQLCSSLSEVLFDFVSPQQKFVRCSVRAEVRHLRKVLCHRLNVEKHQVSQK